jgi:hypothetical protein
VLHDCSWTSHSDLIVCERSGATQRKLRAAVGSRFLDLLVFISVKVFIGMTVSQGIENAEDLTFEGKVFTLADPRERLIRSRMSRSEELQREFIQAH